ncbi:MAG: hypothetical protein GW921_05860, partial [Gallionella sp.]|nr:hypothetical protein [Gallionella sp.]
LRLADGEVMKLAAAVGTSRKAEGEGKSPTVRKGGAERPAEAPQMSAWADGLARAVNKLPSAVAPAVLAHADRSEGEPKAEPRGGEGRAGRDRREDVPWRNAQTRGLALASDGPGGGAKVDNSVNVTVTVGGGVPRAEVERQTRAFASSLRDLALG